MVTRETIMANDAKMARVPIPTSIGRRGSKIRKQRTQSKYSTTVYN